MKQVFLLAVRYNLSNTYSFSILLLLHSLIKLLLSLILILIGSLIKVICLDRIYVMVVVQCHPAYGRDKREFLEAQIDVLIDSEALLEFFFLVFVPY